MPRRVWVSELITSERRDAGGARARNLLYLRDAGRSRVHNLLSHRDAGEGRVRGLITHEGSEGS